MPVSQFEGQQNSRIPASVLYGLVTALSLLFMILEGNKTGFWYDEFAQICFSGGEQTLMDSLMILDPTPPLFNVLANLWYHIVPYGERWLLLLPQLATAGGIYVSALWGERLGGRRAGICTAILMGSSQMVLEQCGFEFRGYGFYLLFSAGVLYLHSKLLDKGKQISIKTWLGYFLLLTGLLYVHVFGTFIFGALSLIDLVLLLRKHISFRHLLAYPAAILFYLPWLVSYLLRASETIAKTEVGWMPTPTLWDVIKLGAYLCGNHIVVCLLMVAGGLMVCRTLFIRSRQEMERVQHLIPILVPAVVIAVAFLYGVIRAPYASLWEKRYFTGLFPCVAVLCAMGAAEIHTLLIKRDRHLAQVAAVICFVLVTPLFLCRIATGNTPLASYYHRELTEVLYHQEDIHEENVIILSTMDQFIEGWEEYYCRQQGKRPGLGIQSIYDIEPDDLKQYDVVYLDYNFWPEKSEELETAKLLDQRYECTDEWKEIRLIRYENREQ